MKTCALGALDVILDSAGASANDTKVNGHRNATKPATKSQISTLAADLCHQHASGMPVARGSRARADSAGSHDGPQGVCVVQSRELAEQQPTHKELHIIRRGARAKLFRNDAAQISN